MLSRLMILAVLVASLGATAGAEQVNVICTDDSPAGDYDYICELGSYEAFFTFDLSAVPDTWLFREAIFTASIEPDSTAQRSLWYGATLISTLDINAAGGFSYYDFTIDVAALDWQGEDSITFMLTGPVDGSHECAYVQFSESGNPASLAVTNPEPGTLALFGVGLLAAFGIHRRRRARRS